VANTIRENFATLAEGKADDQYPVLGLGKQYAQHDAGVTRRTGNIRTARHQPKAAASARSFRSAVRAGGTP
jgi:hypothetical protein